MDPGGHHQGKVDVDEIDAMQFAAELEAVAAVSRARLLGHRKPSRKAGLGTVGGFRSLSAIGGGAQLLLLNGD